MKGNEREGGESGRVEWKGIKTKGNERGERI